MMCECYMFELRECFDRAEKSSLYLVSATNPELDVANVLGSEGGRIVEGDEPLNVILIIPAQDGDEESVSAA